MRVTFSSSKATSGKYLRIADESQTLQRAAFTPNPASINTCRTAFLPPPHCLVRRKPAIRVPPKRVRRRPLVCDGSSAEGNGKPPPQEDSSAPPPPDESLIGSSALDSEEYFERLREMTQADTALSNPLGLKKSFEIVKLDEDGMGPRDRYVYVEERDCIGCTHCATTATGTFFLESEWGRARVFNQTGDTEGDVEVAIDTCPVNCIYYVDWNDLVALENMRDDQVINNTARLVGGSDLSDSRKGTTKTKVMDSGIIRCEDCPGRGCPKCPMFGVGENPEFLKLKKMRDAKKTAKNDKRKSRRKLL